MAEFEEYITQDFLHNLFFEKIRNRKVRGLDRIYPARFAERLNDFLPVALEKINSQSYSFTPYLERLVVRNRKKKPRLISIASIRDQLILLTLKEYLHDCFPTAVNSRLPNNYIKDIVDLNLSSSYRVIQTDIENFFPTISQSQLLEVLRTQIDDERALNLIEKALTNPTVPFNYSRSDRNSYQNLRGVPLGLSISNILANIYLLSIDAVLEEQDCYYFRYTDDILIFTRSNRPKQIVNVLKDLIERKGLRLNNDKTSRERRLTGAFEYLGYKITYPNVSVRDSTYQNFIQRLVNMFYVFYRNFANPYSVSAIIGENPELLKNRFIGELNDRITVSVRATTLVGLHLAAAIYGAATLRAD